MPRHKDWPERFYAFVEARRFMPFAWGSNDCALFAADCVLALTGVDHAEGLRTYTDEAGAAEVIRRAGGMRAFAARLAHRELALAKRGDIVLAVTAGRETFGVVFGDGTWIGPGPTGLAFRPMSEAVAAFEV